MSEQLKEIADRCRRMETRLTKFLESQGFETKVKKPEWQAGSVEVPSTACAIKDIVAAVPADWDTEDEIIVTHKGDEIMSIYLPSRG